MSNSRAKNQSAHQPARRSPYQKIRQQIRTWLQRERGPEAQPIVLQQRRVYVPPTRAGLGVCLALIAMLIAAINYGLSLAYLFTFLIASVGLAHVLASWRHLVGLGIHIRPDGEAFAGQAARFRVTFLCATRKHRDGIRLIDSNGTLLLELDSIAPDSPDAFFTLPAPTRGWLWVGQLRLETRAPLGWVCACSYIQPDARALIYPAPQGDARLPQHHSAGDPQQLRRTLLSDNEEFAGLREYRDNDPMSRVAWRRNARDGAWLVKQFEGLSSSQLALNWHELPPHLNTEARLSQLTLWLLQARQGRQNVSLQLPGEAFSSNNSEAHYQHCLASLATFHAELMR